MSPDAEAEILGKEEVTWAGSGQEWGPLAMAGDISGGHILGQVLLASSGWWRPGVQLNILSAQDGPPNKGLSSQKWQQCRGGEIQA